MKRVEVRMTSGELLTRATIWISILAYFFGAVVFALSRKRYKWDSVARLAWTAACVALLAHVACAFHFYHAWSQSSAYRDTARQTDQVIGLNWGGGLYVNYALVICWTMDVMWWWIGGLNAYRRRPWPLMLAWHGFIIFIVFNATIVFKAGFVRWMGLSICLGICLGWWLATRGTSSQNPIDSSPRVAAD